MSYLFILNDINYNSRLKSYKDILKYYDNVLYGGVGDVQAQNHADYKKFFKLLSMRRPLEQVKISVQNDGLDPNILDDPTQLIPYASRKYIFAKDHPKYEPYFKMISDGESSENVKKIIEAAAAADPDLDLDPEIIDEPEKIMSHPNPSNLQAPAAVKIVISKKAEDAPAEDAPAEKAPAGKAPAGASKPKQELTMQQEMALAMIKRTKEREAQGLAQGDDGSVYSTSTPARTPSGSLTSTPRGFTPGQTQSSKGASMATAQELLVASMEIRREQVTGKKKKEEEESSRVLVPETFWKPRIDDKVKIIEEKFRNFRTLFQKSKRPTLFLKREIPDLINPQAEIIKILEDPGTTIYGFDLFNKLLDTLAQNMTVVAALDKYVHNNILTAHEYIKELAKKEKEIKESKTINTGLENTIARYKVEIAGLQEQVNVQSKASKSTMHDIDESYIPSIRQSGSTLDVALTSLTSRASMGDLYQKFNQDLQELTKEIESLQTRVGSLNSMTRIETDFSKSLKERIDRLEQIMELKKIKKSSEDPKSN